MNVVKRVNGLNGEQISRADLHKIYKKAKEQEQTQIAEKIEAILNQYDDAYFDVNIDQPFFEETPHYILDNLPFEETPEEEYTGLNKAVSPDEIYQYITDLVINTIKAVGHLPWQREWEKTSLFNGWQAINYDSKKGYRGINYVLTNFEVKMTEEGPALFPRDLSNPYFLTFNQIEKHGGKLKKGSKGVRVVYFTKLYSHTERDPKTGNTILEFGTYNQKKFIAWLQKNRSKIKQISSDKDFDRLANSYIPILKYYNVFAGADVEGIDWGLMPKNENADKPKRERIEVAESIIDAMPNAPKIRFKGDQPAYYPAVDEILMTPIEAFISEEPFYCTLFHELTHSTGHRSRLGRLGIASRDIATKRDKAFEELIAEMGAVFLCAESGILFSVLDNSAKYLRGWNSQLVDRMKEDNRFFFRAASKAQAASDYILDRDKDGQPAYLKELAKKINSKNSSKTPLLDKMKDPKQLTDAEILQVGKEYATAGMWSDEVRKYVDEVIAEKERRSENKNFEDPEFYRKDLDLQTLINSRNGISFSPDKRATYELKVWGDDNAERYKYLKEKAKTEKFDITQLNKLYDRYYSKLLKLKKDEISARSRLLSTMITGPANFPVRKANAASDRHHDIWGKYLKFAEKGYNKILSKVYSRETVRSGSSGAIDQLKERLNAFVALNEAQKYFNKNLVGKKSTDEEKKLFFLERNIKNNYKAAYPTKSGQMADWRMRDALKGDRLVFLYMSKNINDLKKRIKGEEMLIDEKKDLDNNTEKYENVELVINNEANRVQLIFDGKPDEETRAKLKKNGFRWSPKFGAWQRQANRNGILIAQRVIKEVGIKAEGKPVKQLNERNPLVLEYEKQNPKVVSRVVYSSLTEAEKLKYVQNRIKPDPEAKPDPAPKPKKKPVKKSKAEKQNEKAKPGDQLALLGEKPEATKAKSLPGGFVIASEGPKKQIDTFRLPGEFGKLLGDLQAYQLAILLTGDPHAGKSEFVTQLTNAFLNAGFKGAYFDLEQGGLVSKDTQNAFNRNITPENQAKLAVTGEAPQGIDSVKAVADQFEFVVIDSFQELNAPINGFNELRKEHPNTIFIVIFQQNGKGGTRGGIKGDYDAPVRLKVYRVDETFVNNYAQVEKNRGNKIGLQYNVSQKRVLDPEAPEENNEPQPEPQPVQATRPQGTLIIH